MLQLKDLSSDGSDDNNVLRKELEEKLQHVESLNKTLIVKECMSNREMQDARKEAIRVCFASDLLSFSHR